MKKSLSLASIIAVLFSTASLQAGPPVVESKSIVSTQPSEIFGTGPYVALDLGANVYQDRGGSRTFTNFFGNTLVVDPKNDVGFYGGIKAGWVFGTGVFRPTIEADLFYNGFRGGADGTLTQGGVVTRVGSGTSYINTGAFMSNFIAKFAFDRFQPYVGGGVGVYYAESAGFDFNGTGGSFGTSGGANHADLAWQVIAGADYYWNPKWSTFIEYHYLDYTNTKFETGEIRDLGQHLVGGGMRFHF